MAAPEVLGWFPSPLINRVLVVVGSFLGQNYRLNQETEILLIEWKASLLTVKWAIEAFEMRPEVPIQTLPEWLRELKDATYEAFDVLDTIEYKNMCNKLNNKVSMMDFLKQKVSLMIWPSSAERLGTLTISNYDLESLKLVAYKFKIFAGEIENLIYSLNIKHNETQNVHKKQKIGDNIHHLDGLKLFGRDEEINLILDMMGVETNNSGSILENRTNKKLEHNSRGKKSVQGRSSKIVQTRNRNQFLLGVIPIVGIAGVGKTALAKVIYNDPSIIEHFKLRSWVYVPESKSNISRRILESASPPIQVGISTLLMMAVFDDAYQHEFTRTIKNKRFFLVLDDVREGDLNWENLRYVLIKAVAPGSIVLVTTQSRRVAYEAGTMARIQLDVLQENNFWPLFEHYAFGRESIDDNIKGNLQIIGKEIAKKLKGLPLAGVTTGYLLRQKLDIEHWKNILESDWWNIGTNLGRVLPALAVSFYNLDIELREWFTFCALIPKATFTINDLIEMWISHGFMNSSIGQNDSLKGFAKKRFNQLLDRSFFQPVTRTVTFYMPNSIRDLANGVSSNEMCMIKDGNICVPRMMRHLTLFHDEIDDLEWRDYKMNRLRTLLIYCHKKEQAYDWMGLGLGSLFRPEIWCSPQKDFLKSTLSKSKNLRILDLSNVELGREPPHEISSLFHLRSLNLANTTIEVFPKSFCMLLHLRVLNLNGCHFDELPRQFNQLTNLRFLHASSETIYLIYGIGNLTKLQSFNNFCVRNGEGFRLTELKGMNEIDGCLKIYGLNNISSKEEAIEAKLVEKKFLRRLEFIGEHQLIVSFNSTYTKPSSPVSNFVEIFEALKPHINIEELVIHKYPKTTFLGWMIENHSFTNLKFVRLSDCNLVVLPNLGQLPTLAVLEINKLHYIYHIDGQIYGDDTDIFPSLKELSFFSMSSWFEWSDARAGRCITSLKKLRLINCPRLRGIPLQSLGRGVTELELLNCGPFINEVSTYFERFTALTTLKIGDCKPRISIPCYNLRFLEFLYLHDCDNLHFKGRLKSLIKLKKLEIIKCGEVNESLYPEGSNREFGLGSLIYLDMSYVKFPDQLINMLGILPLLRILKVEGYFRADRDHWFSELTSLDEIYLGPYRLSIVPVFPSLEKLTLINCRDLLPHNGLPRNLKELYIIECSDELKDRCWPEVGEDWPNIAHVPYINIDGETIQML